MKRVASVTGVVLGLAIDGMPLHLFAQDSQAGEAQSGDSGNGNGY